MNIRTLLNSAYLSTVLIGCGAQVETSAPPSEHPNMDCAAWSPDGRFKIWTSRVGDSYLGFRFDNGTNRSARPFGSESGFSGVGGERRCVVDEMGTVAYQGVEHGVSAVFVEDVYGNKTTIPHADHPDLNRFGRLVYTQYTSTAESGVFLNNFPFSSAPQRLTVMPRASHPLISGDGNVAAFMVEGAFGSRIYRYDISSGRYESISPMRPGFVSDQDSLLSISYDGAVLLFASSFPVLPEDRNQQVDLYTYDDTTRSYTRVTVNSHGNEIANPELDLSQVGMSGNGRYVAWVSSSYEFDSSIVGNAIFVQDLERGITRKVRDGSDFWGIQYSGNSFLFSEPDSFSPSALSLARFF